jgi:hypothetical protein
MCLGPLAVPVAGGEALGAGGPRKPEWGAR